MMTQDEIKAYLLDKMQANPESDGSFIMESSHSRLFGAIFFPEKGRVSFAPVTDLPNYPCIDLSIPTTKEAMCAAIAAAAAATDALPGELSGREGR